MTRYYCSGFDIKNAFGHGLGEQFKHELKRTDNIVYIPSSPEKIEKSRTKYIPLFSSYFATEGIEFINSHLLTPETPTEKAQELIKNADFVMLMGGDPFAQKALCKKLGIVKSLKNYDGLMLGFSAGAMLMSKYIIVTPCSEEYPDFRIEEGLNLDGISIYPHNNTSAKKYPEELISGDETYKKSDLIEVAGKYGKFYLLQDNLREDGSTDVSIIKANGENFEFYTENEGKIWEADTDIRLICDGKRISNDKFLKFANNRNYSAFAL